MKSLYFYFGLLLAFIIAGSFAILGYAVALIMLSRGIFGLFGFIAQMIISFIGIVLCAYIANYSFDNFD